MPPPMSGEDSARIQRGVELARDPAVLANCEATELALVCDAYRRNSPTALQLRILLDELSRRNVGD